jgi:hypothetical protein
MRKDPEHEERKKLLRDFPDGEILRQALEMAVLDDTEKEALRLYIFNRVPIKIIAERLGYESTYFSREKFKRILIKYVYCIHKIQKAKTGEG